MVDLVCLVVPSTGVLMVPCVPTATKISVHLLVVEEAVVAAAQALLSRVFLVLVLTIYAVSALKKSHLKKCASGRACGHAAVSVSHPSLGSNLWSPSQCITVLVDTVSESTRPLRIK